MDNNSTLRGDDDCVLRSMVVMELLVCFDLLLSIISPSLDAVLIV